MRSVNDCIVRELSVLERMASQNSGAAMMSPEVRRLADAILKPHLNALRELHEAPDVT